MTQAATGSAPVMWGNIVGFGRYPHQYASGRTRERSLVGFVPRKSDLTLYIMPGFGGMDTQLAQFGKHKIGKSVRYIKRLEDVYMTCQKNHRRQRESDGVGAGVPLKARSARRDGRIPDQQGRDMRKELRISSCMPVLVTMFDAS